MSLGEGLARLIGQPLLVVAMFVLVVIAGVGAFRELPVDAFPDLTNNQVQVLTETPGLAPVETEEWVTLPLESVLNGLPRVQEVRAISKLGLSVVTVVFDDGVDPYFARQQVNERLQLAPLPEGIRPQLGPLTTGMGEIYQYVLGGVGYSAMDLKTLHDWELRPLLRAVPGVSEVNTWGGLTQEFQVTVDPVRLQTLGLSLTEVFESLRANNLTFGGGVQLGRNEQYTVRGLGRVQGVQDIQAIGLPKPGVTVGDVATVTLGAAFRQGAASQDGQGEVVTGMVMMRKGENSRSVIERVKNTMAKLPLPEGTWVTPFYDQTKLIDQTLHTLQTNLLEGSMLVVAVLLLLLGNIRAALIVATVIPISLLFSFMGMRALGVSASIISLGALDFGMIVDGAIVLVENTLRQHTGSRLERIQTSLREMARPITFGVLIITVVYLPVLALEGIEYRLFSPLVFTVVFALLGALITTLTLVPVLCRLFLKGEEKESPVFAWLRPRYVRLLQGALRRPKRTVGVTVAAFLLAVGSVPFFGSEFVPRLDEGDLIVEVRNLPSVNLQQAVATATRAEQAIKNLPGVATVVSKTGRPDLATDPMGVYATDLYVILTPGTLTDALMEPIRERLAHLGAATSLTQPIAMRVNELVSGVRSDVAVKVLGDDLPTLLKSADRIAEVLSSVPGHADVQVERVTGAIQRTIQPDRAAMRRYGVEMADLQQAVDATVLGLPVTQVLDGRKRFDIRLKLPPEELNAVLLQTQDGHRLPLAQVARVDTQEGIEVISREYSQRRVLVQANVSGRDLGSFVAEAQSKIERLKLPPGVRLVWGGQFENQQRAMAKLLWVVPLAILLIFMLLLMHFEGALSMALLVLLNVPFALIGGVAALWLRGLYLSVPAVIGLIALFGVAILNGLVLVTTLNRLRGMPNAIVMGAEQRLRPVLLTALVAGLGFVPMALSTGAGAEVQRPLATVVIGGLVTSTLLTLWVLPLVYGLFNRNDVLDQAADPISTH
jgi:cobalt-zinc-cadmium resistance protein CzcA